MPNIWWMPIQTRTEMLATGIRSPLGIKVFGDDLARSSAPRSTIERAVADGPGHPQRLRRALDRRLLPRRRGRPRGGARYGLTVARRQRDRRHRDRRHGDRHETVEGRERYPINVRYARELPRGPGGAASVLVATPDRRPGAARQVARIRFATGPPMVRSEDGRLVGYVFVDPGERPIADYVEEARAVVAERVELPPACASSGPGSSATYERAKERLVLVVPLTLLLVALLLYFNTGSVVETGIVLLAVPFSLIGAVWLLWLLDYHLSVAVWVGLIALAGLDAETGVVMLLYLKLAHRRHARRGTARSTSPT
jgi:copper/silver efflux system protein